MIHKNDRIYFGFFKGNGFSFVSDDYQDFEEYKNNLPKDLILQHIHQITEVGYASGNCTDIFTGEALPVQRGMYEDGDFTFPTGFVYYLETRDIGIPYEYEEYIKSVL